MLIIGERINGMFKDVRKAIRERDANVIQQLARAQVEAGAGALDVNVGPASDDPVGAMKWLVETIRQVTGIPLAIDTTKAEAMKAGLQLAGPGSIINSTTGQQEKLDVLLPMAVEHNASIIGLTIDEKGVPRDETGRVEVALKIVATAAEAGLEPDRVYIDAVILPMNCMQENPGHVYKTIRECKMLSDPAPKTVIGLSNVSQGTTKRELVNRTCLVMAIAAGLDAAVADALDTELMDAMITAELLLNKQIYCEDYIVAWHKSHARA